jgi:hypothetical protein
MLEMREDVFEDYCRDEFEKVFRQYFIIKSMDKIKGSARTMYLMKRK